MIDEASAISKDDLESLKATDQDTAIANSLESVAKSATATPAGILLLTDGIDTLLHSVRNLFYRTSVLEVYQYIPFLLDSKNPMTSPSTTSLCRRLLFLSDRVPVRVQLFSKGYEKRTAKLTVRLNNRQVSQRRLRWMEDLVETSTSM